MQQNSPFLLRFPVFAQLFVSHAPVCGGAWRLGGRLVGGMAGLRRTVPVFLRRDGYTAPLQTVCGVCGGGCVFGGLHARQRDAVLPLQRGAGLLQICHSLFCPPCPAPDSRFPPCRFLFAPAPEVHLKATKIADLSQAQNPAAFTETQIPAPSFQSILCKLQPLTRHSVRHLPYNKGVLPCVNLQLIYLKQL